MSLLDSRFSDKEHQIRRILLNKAHYVTLKGFEWSPFDSAFRCHVEHRFIEGPTQVYVDTGTDTVRWADPEAERKVVEGIKAEALRERQAKHVNDCRGDHVQVLKVILIGTDEPHTFKVGPGPCGRTVRALKVDEQADRLVIYQFCEDNLRADKFTYLMSDLKRWICYQTLDYAPAKVSPRGHEEL